MNCYFCEKPLIDGTVIEGELMCYECHAKYNKLASTVGTVEKYTSLGTLHYVEKNIFCGKCGSTKLTQMTEFGTNIMKEYCSSCCYKNNKTVDFD